MHARHKLLLLLIIIFAVLVRLVVVATAFDKPLSMDEPSYDIISWNLASGHGYQVEEDETKTWHPTALRGPYYISFVSAIYSIFGHKPFAVMLIQALLDVLGCFFSFRICRLLFSRYDISLAGAALYALYPPFILQTKWILTETLVDITFMAAVLYYLEFKLLNKRWGLAASAIAIGLVALSKPIVALLPVLFFLAGYAKKKRTSAVRELGLQILLVAVVMSPWIIRNAIALDSFIPGVTMGGITFWFGTSPPEWKPGDPLPIDTLNQVAGLSEIERDKWFYKDGVRVVKANPKRYLGVLVKKIPQLWLNLAHAKPPSKASILVAVFNVLALVCAAVGIMSLRPPTVASRLLALLIVYFTLAHLVFAAVIRLSYPIYTYIFCFTAAGVVAIIQRLVSSLRPQTT